MNPQEFLLNRIKQITSPEGLESIGYMKANPILGAVNGISKMTGGPGLTKGFQEGVTRKDGRDGTYDVVLPPMPF